MKDYAILTSRGEYTIFEFNNQIIKCNGSSKQGRCV